MIPTPSDMKMMRFFGVMIVFAAATAVTAAACRMFRFLTTYCLGCCCCGATAVVDLAVAGRWMRMIRIGRTSTRRRFLWLQFGKIHHNLFPDRFGIGRIANGQAQERASTAAATAVAIGPLERLDIFQCRLDPERVLDHDGWRRMLWRCFDDS